MSHGIRWSPEQLEAHRRKQALQRVVIKVDEAGAKIVRPKTKYGSVKTGKHASKKESKRAKELRLLEASGDIFELVEQRRFELIPAQYIDGKCVERAMVYVADFTYYERGHPGQLVVEDCKGYRTQVYRIKKKLLLFRHGLRIRET